MTHIRRKQKLQYEQGREAEYWFRKWTGAEDAPSSLDIKHIDCIWNGRTVDVKGIKSCHKDGYVLVEFKTVDGRDGWGTKAGAELVAFQFPEGFYVVETMDLFRMAQRKVTANPTGSAKGSAIRGNNISPSSGLYCLVGRAGRKDVFTYVRKEDVMDLKHDFISST